MIQQQDSMLSLRLIKRIPPIARVRLATVVLILTTIAIGLGCKQYSGPGHAFVNNWGPASVCYEVLFVLVGFLVFPRRAMIAKIAICVCLLTCLVEISQLFHIQWLDELRKTFFGRMLLGTSFSWWDFPAYPVGAWVGWIVARWISRLDTTGTASDARA